MPSVSRVGDTLSTGHACTGTTTIASSATDGTVKVNSINAIECLKIYSPAFLLALSIAVIRELCSLQAPSFMP